MPAEVPVELLDAGDGMGFQAAYDQREMTHKSPAWRAILKRLEANKEASEGSAFQVENQECDLRGRRLRGGRGGASPMLSQHEK